VNIVPFEVENLRTMELTKSYLKDLTYKVTGAAIEVHKRFGPGLLESVYHKCLAKELELRKISFKSEYKIPYNYKGFDLDIELLCDFLIDGVLVVELKAIESILPVHEAQILTYMKLLEVPKGLMLNFNVENLYYDGQKTYVNQIFQNLPEIRV
jgi:GxxExxY protein